MLEVLHILAKRENYTRFVKYIKDHYLEAEEVRLIVRGLDDYYTTTTEDEVNWGDYKTWFYTVKYPSLPESKTMLYDKLFTALDTTPAIREELHNQILNKFILRDTGRRIAECALQAHDGDVEDLDDVWDMMQTYSDETDSLIDARANFVSHDVTELMSTTATQGMEPGLSFFQKALGPYRSDFIVVSSRPDGGKTTLLCNEINAVAKQIPDDETVLVINNEGSGERYKYRLIQNELNITQRYLEANTAQCEADYYAIIPKEKIEIFDSRKPVTTKTVDYLLKTIKPGMIVFDQLWKVHGYHKEKEYQRLTMLCNWAKEHGIAYGCPVFTAHQADGSAEGEQWITMNQLYGSKTGIQGEADAIITIGQSSDPALWKSRFLFVPKNKLLGGVNSDPTMRRGRQEVILHAETAQWEEPNATVITPTAP